VGCKVLCNVYEERSKNGTKVRMFLTTLISAGNFNGDHLQLQNVLLIVRFEVLSDYEDSCLLE
jgi:hypothetical protein